TFFFVNSEALREHRSLTGTFSLPPTAVRGGDFAALPTIYDPLSGDPATLRRTPFAGNRIPAGRLDPIAAAFLAKVPLPNAGGVQTLLATPVLINDNPQLTARLDHQFRTADAVHGRYTRSSSETFRPFGSSDLNETLVPGFGVWITTYTHSLALSH